MDGCRRQRSPGDPAPRSARGNQRLVVQRAGLCGQPRQSVRRTGVAADEAAGRHAVRLFQAVLGHGRAGRLPRGRVARRRRGNVRAPQPAFRPFASLSGSGRGEVCQRAFPRAAVPAYAVRELLRTIRPLFAQHLGDAGIGSVSEIFDGDPPHLPNGCIAQAWSVAECLRLLHLLKEAAPGVYAEWEANARKGGN